MMTEKILQSWSSLRWRSDNNIHFSYVLLSFGGSNCSLLIFWPLVFLLLSDTVGILNIRTYVLFSVIGMVGMVVYVLVDLMTHL